MAWWYFGKLYLLVHYLHMIRAIGPRHAVLLSVDCILGEIILKLRGFVLFVCFLCLVFVYCFCLIF